jgi:hypothetical protein
LSPGGVPLTWISSDPWEYRLGPKVLEEAATVVLTDSIFFLYRKTLPSYYPKSIVMTFQHTRGILETVDNPFPNKNNKNM